jgi:protein ImuB
VQAMLGPDAVVTAVLGGGRDPAERVRLVPWGDDRGSPPDPGATDPGAADPGAADPVAPDPGVPELDAVPPGSAPPGPVLPFRDPVPGLVPAGWPTDVLPAAGARPSDLPVAVRRRSGSARSPVREPPPPWPGRLPAPSPAVVPPTPLPAELHDAAGRPVRLTAPDLLTAPPYAITVDGDPAGEVSGWAGPWPVWQRWWTPAGVAGSRLQVVRADGAAFLLLVRDGRWWVTGVYD